MHSDKSERWPDRVPLCGTADMNGPSGFYSLVGWALAVLTSHLLGSLASLPSPLACCMILGSRISLCRQPVSAEGGKLGGRGCSESSCLAQYLPNSKAAGVWPARPQLPLARWGHVLEVQASSGWSAPLRREGKRQRLQGDILAGTGDSPGWSQPWDGETRAGGWVASGCGGE